MYNRWWTLRNDATVSRSGFERKIHVFAARISGARVRDKQVWKTLDRIDRSKVAWPLWECRDYNSPTTFEEEIAKLKRFTRARIDWMDAKIAESRFLNP
jgi:hypothetical protein